MIVRWGICGTGSIAGWMAHMIRLAAGAEIAAVSSRRMPSAREFADEHGIPIAVDSWSDLCRADAVDAVYVATPTSTREEICLAAIANGKHVLGEKPFTSVESVKRITAACRDGGVAFMDGTHFVHHPRSRFIQEHTVERLGRVTSVASAFQFNLDDKSNIRFDPGLEPMGAIGDTGWYNMRAAVEYLAGDAELASVSAHMRRDVETGAVIGGSGVLSMRDASTSTWNCGFDAGGVVMDLSVTGTSGVYSVDDFLSQNRDGSADLWYRRGDWNDAAQKMTIASDKPGAALMFENFTAAVADASLRERWMTATERTQVLLDAVWKAGLASERG